MINHESLPRCFSIIFAVHRSHIKSVTRVDCNGHDEVSRKRKRDEAASVSGEVDRTSFSPLSTQGRASNIAELLQRCRGSGD
jgi:hypothetical protein